MNIRRLLGSLAIATLAVVLAACGSSIQSGRITGKVYEEPYSWIQMVCVSYDKNSICTVQVPVTHEEPAHYRFNLEDGDKTGYVYVSPETFENHQTGDWVDFGN